ncbi:MAG: recombinase family protein [Rhizobiaceae bacterium]
MVNPVVIIDDISRLARGLDAHPKLRQSLSSAGGKLESPSIKFGDDPDSIMVENLLATAAQHQREKNGQNTLNRMRGRMMNGYWMFHAPVGYKYEKVSGHGKMLVPDEPNASIIKEGLEGYASGQFQTLTELWTRARSSLSFSGKMQNSGCMLQTPD